MNSAYIAKLMELAEKDSNVLHLLADSGTGYDVMFHKNFPTQMFNFGIGEENMVAAAAGLATAGKIPFVFTAGAFLAYRAMEFIRDDVCFQNLNVKIVGMGSGLSWSSLGPTHHTTEDLAVLRSLPNLKILSPATPNQVAACVEEAYNHKGPVYIRMGMNKETEFFEDGYSLNATGTDKFFNGAMVIVFTTGSILDEVINAVELLKKDGVEATVYNVVSIKPFDKEYIQEIISGKNIIYSVEEHSIYGGLGSIIAETIAYEGLANKIVPIGIGDCFAKGYGTHAMVRKANQLDALSIYQRIKETMQDE